MTERRPSYFALCSAEPYRLFFPLATLIGISGVSLWPLFFSGLHRSFYPGFMHARLMIEGFLGGFVIGFLGTAMPRLLSAPALRGWEVALLAVLHLSVAGLHIGHQVFLGDAMFAAELSFFAVCLLRRLIRRVDLPPPSFVLVALGYFSGLVGAVLWCLGMRGYIAPELMLMGGMWLNEAFVLLLILGVGGFLLPRFLCIEGLAPLDEERKASRAWLRRAAFALVVGFVMLGSYWAQAIGLATQGAVLARSVAAIAFVIIMIPAHRGRILRPTVPRATIVALAGLIAGLLFPLWEQQQRVAGLHVIFIAGFSVITFTVATRVVLGHSGLGRKFEGGLPSLDATVVLLVIGAILRAAGDFLPMQRSALLSGASYLWMVAAVIWALAILPKTRISEPEA
jgi:uncharacterized protein involved in response to NO